MSIYNTEGFSSLFNQPSDEQKVDNTNLSHIPSYSSMYNSKNFSILEIQERNLPHTLINRSILRSIA